MVLVAVLLCTLLLSVSWADIYHLGASFFPLWMSGRATEGLGLGTLWAAKVQYGRRRPLVDPEAKRVRVAYDRKFGKVGAEAVPVVPAVVPVAAPVAETRKPRRRGSRAEDDPAGTIAADVARARLATADKLRDRR